MFRLSVGPQAQGTPAETLQKLVDAAGLVITVQGRSGLGETVEAIIGAAPRLSEDHEVRPDGLIMSRVGMYRVFWGVVSYPAGSLAVLLPLPGHDGQDSSDWAGHFRREVLDPVLALSQRGYSTGGGGNGHVDNREFAEAFRHAYV